MYAELSYRLGHAQERVLTSGDCMLGLHTRLLEERIAKLSGARYCAVTGSGSDALYMGLVACRVKHISIPAQTYIATHNSAVRAFCDISWADVDTKGCIDWQTVEKQDVVWVGLFGNPCSIPSNLRVYEDGAQHLGLPMQGIFAAYSFDPTKTLPNFGNGGAVVSDDEDVVYAVKQLRRHSWIDMHVGGNSIMSERDCAELLVKLEYFDIWTKRRRELAEYYTAELQDYVEIITDSAGMVSKFVIATDRAGDLRTHLNVNNVQTKSVYEQALHNLPQATLNCKRFVSIPCDSYTTDEESAQVVDAIKMFFEPVPLKT